MTKSDFICSICGQPGHGFGHNAQPVNDGRCCNECNTTVVIPTRFAQIDEDFNKWFVEGKT